jgi:Raf kinase inhibitor-like YbhB/YbcL family protein
MPFRLTTTAFPGAVIPAKYACDGVDVSPAVAWHDPPKGTQSFALIADDPDAPAGTWVHWVIYDVPAGSLALPEDIPKERELPDGTRQGRNDFGKIGYNGPCPPKGTTHRYCFKLYALDTKLDLKTGASKGELERNMKGHVLAQTELVARFGH